MKRLFAFIVALGITGVVGLGAIAIGWDALGQTTAAAEDAADGTLLLSDDTESGDRVQELELLVSQYKQRESEYRARLAEAEQQLQESQQILDALQRRGALHIEQHGEISIGHKDFEQDDDE